MQISARNCSLRPTHQISNSFCYSESKKYQAQKAIQTLLDSYPVSNETTRDEIADYINQIFINTEKLEGCFVRNIDKINATVDTASNMDIFKQISLINRIVHSFCLKYHNITLTKGRRGCY